MLTERECRTAQPGSKDCKHFDGGGLHLLVKPSGYKSWRLKYRFGGKEKQLTFGPYPTVSLKQARQLREDAKRLLLDGSDPGKVKANRSATQRVDPEDTFRAAGLRWHALQSHGWKPRHAAKVMQSLEREIFPVLGETSLGDIRPKDIRPILETMQDRGSIDQAHRVLTRISRIFDLAIVMEEAEINPAASLKLLLRPTPKRKYPALTDLDQVRQALKAFEREAHQPETLLASRLLALTASRPGPIRFARPEQFVDLDGAAPRWIIPAADLKLKRADAEKSELAFTIPLSSQAVATVKAAMTSSEGREWLFPAVHFGQRPISENALNVAYKRSPLFSGRHVPHGWRSSFSTIMNERAIELERPGDRAIIDLMLGHKPSGVESRYNRAAYMPRRRSLAQEWADMLTEGLVLPARLLEGLRN